MMGNEVRDRVLSALCDAFEGQFTVDAPDPQKQMDGSFTVRVVLRPVDTKAMSQTYAGVAQMLGLPEDVVGAKYRIGRKLFEVTGLNLGRPKNPVGLRCMQTSKSFKCSPAYLKSGTRIGA